MAVVKTDDNLFYESLRKLYDAAAFLYGPNSQQLVLESKDKNILRMVSSSRELLEQLQPKDDVLKLLLNMLKNHMQLSGDGGLFTTMLASNLILKSHNEEIPFHVMATYGKLILDRMEEIVSQSCFQVDIGKLSEIFCILKPILCSKLLLKEDELTHLCLLFAKTFGSIFPHSDLSSVSVVIDNSSNISDSSLHNGCLLRLGFRIESDTKAAVAKLRNRNVLLISTSLSLSSDEFIAESATKITVESVEQLKTDLVLNKLMAFCNRLIAHGSIIVCQKVVHPLVKSYLRSQDVLCIERVGSMDMPKLGKLFGCKPISTLNIDNISDHVGKVDDLHCICIDGKSYLKVASREGTTKTIVLCCRNERQGDILKQCYETSMAVLKNLLIDASVLMGGGCIETKLCMDLLSGGDIPAPASLGCSELVLKKILNLVAKALLDTCSNIEMRSSYFEHSIDSSYHHHWINASSASSCCCGLVKRNTSELRFTSFEELLCSDVSGLPMYSKPQKATPLDAKVSFLCHPKNFYLANVRAAFQAAEIVSRVGYRVSDG